MAKQAAVVEDFDINELGQPEVPTVTTQSSQVQQPQVDPNVTQKLDQIASGQSQQNVLVQLLAMPEVQAIIAARQLGKQVKVIPLGDDGNGPPPEQINQPAPTIDWDSMKEDPQKLAAHLSQTLSQDVSRTVQNILKTTIQQIVDPLKEQVTGLQGVINTHQETQLKGEMGVLRQKYSDFDQMIPTMKEVNRKTGGGLGLERLYQVAKLESGQPLVPDQTVETERPTNTAVRSGQPAQKKQYASSRGGFQTMVEDALDDFDFGPWAR